MMDRITDFKINNIELQDISREKGEFTLSLYKNNSPFLMSNNLDEVWMVDYLYITGTSSEENGELSIEITAWDKSDTHSLGIEYEYSGSLSELFFEMKKRLNIKCEPSDVGHYEGDQFIEADDSELMSRLFTLVEEFSSDDLQYLDFDLKNPIEVVKESRKKLSTEFKEKRKKKIQEVLDSELMDLKKSLEKDRRIKSVEEDRSYNMLVVHHINGDIYFISTPYDPSSLKAFSTTKEGSDNNEFGFNTPFEFLYAIEKGKLESITLIAKKSFRIPGTNHIIESGNKLKILSRKEI